MSRDKKRVYKLYAKWKFLMKKNEDPLIQLIQILSVGPGDTPEKDYPEKVGVLR